MQHFTPVSSLLGGILIGLAVSLYLLSFGKIAGISGLFGGLFDSGAEDKATRALFLAGLILVGVFARAFAPSQLPTGTGSLLIAAVAGLVVGFGTRLGNGCTSGHGVCGISRLSRRSILATMTFMLTGIVTVTILKAVGGVL